MGAYQNYNSVVVNLESGNNAQNSTITTATYEQAFLGENFSDAKGRAKRTKRKLDRIAAKREVRTERRKLKGDKQEERISRRGTRKLKRQDVRDEQMKRRSARKKEKAPEEVDETTDESIDETTETRDSEQDGYGDMQDEDIDSSNDYTDDDDYEEDDSDDDDYEEDDSDDDYYEADDSDENDYDENSNITGSSEDEVFADEESNFVSEVTGSSNLPKSIKVICYQIEMTNEALSNLMQVKALKQKQGQSTDSIDKDLQTKFNQAQKLESKLEQFSGANGVSSNEIKKEKRKARMKRLMNAPIPPVIMAKLVKLGWDKSKIEKWWEQRGRKSTMSKFSFEGTSDEFGSINELNKYVDPDEMGVPAYDYDQPKPKMVNLDGSKVNSNFSESSNNYMRSLIIGGIVAFAGIWAIRKYKLLS